MAKVLEWTPDMTEKFAAAAISAPSCYDLDSPFKLTTDSVPRLSQPGAGRTGEVDCGGGPKNYNS